jgi:hypothetical protein
MTEQLRGLGPLRWRETVIGDNGHEEVLALAPAGKEA